MEDEFSYVVSRVRGWDILSALFASSLPPWSFPSFLLGLSGQFDYVSREGAEAFCSGVFNLRLSCHMPFRCNRK